MSDFFDTFRARWKLASEAEEPQREKELADLEFESGVHWTDAELKARTGKPSLTIDLLSGPIKQVTNAQRTARPGIQVSPVGGGADPKKAERWQGIIRRVERLSGRSPYTWAGQHQAKMGRGFWAVRNIEVGDHGEQDIRIEEIDNQHTVYCDPTCKKLDGSDKKWAIRFEDLTHEDYKARFGDSDLAKTIGESGFLSGVGDAPPEWITSSHCRIAEYYYVEDEPRTRYVLSDGTAVWADETAHEATRDKGKFARAPVLPEGVTVRRQVKKSRRRVHWCLLNGAGEKLDSTVIPGEYVPVVMIWGERRNVNGKVDYRGMVRMAKDPSRMEDFCESSLMETIALAKTAPWLAEWDQISEFQKIWESSNRINYAVLPYKRTSGENGQPIPPPQRIAAGVDVSAVTLAAQRMQNHVRAVTGVPDTFQDETQAQQASMSGRAILARQSQQQLGTSDYLENLGDGIVLTAKIIMSMAREVYDTPRVMRILGEDEKEHEVITHLGPDQREQAMQLQTKDVEDLFDLSVGEYDVTIAVGKSYHTSRQEAVEAVNAAVSAYPAIAPVALPILFKNSDWPGAQEIARAMQPDETQKIPPQVQQQLQQADQMLQMATERIKELEAKDAANETKARADLMKATIQAEVQAALQQMKGQHALELERLRIQGQKFLQDDQQAHDLGLASAEAEQAEAMARQQAERDERAAERGAVREGMAGDLAHRRTVAQQATTPRANGSGR